jgi:hypothetical protein
MAILESQIRFLRTQVRELSGSKLESSGNELAEAVALSWSLFERVRASVKRHATDSTIVCEHYRQWLVGAEEIIPLLRTFKAAVSIDDRRRFIHTVLEARAAVAREDILPGSRTIPLDEVGRELQHRS